MSKIGTFKKAAEGAIVGTLHTLAVSRDIEFNKIERTSERAPSFRATLSGTDIAIGAGWLKAAKESGNNYVSVQLDDPSLPAPLNARLVQNTDSEDYSLYWERSKPQKVEAETPAEPAEFSRLTQPECS